MEFPKDLFEYLDSEIRKQEFLVSTLERLAKNACEEYTKNSTRLDVLKHFKRKREEEEE